MRQPRLFTEQPLAVGQTARLSDGDAHYLGRVLRLQPGAGLTLFNGLGGEYDAVLTEVARNGAAAEVRAHDPVERESPLSITLVQGVSRGERMDYTIQKAVELGVTRIVPVETARSVVRLKGERRARRRLHWQGVARAAAMQCGRNRVPTVADPCGLRDALASATGLCLLLDPVGAAPLSTLAQPADGALTLLIGPEGGLADDEIEQARSGGFRPVQLGPRVLRTETAGMAALAALQVLWGDLG